MARDIKKGFNKFAQNPVVVIGDARPGAQERYEASRAGLKRQQVETEKLTLRGDYQS